MAPLYLFMCVRVYKCVCTHVADTYNLTIRMYLQAVAHNLNEGAPSQSHMPVDCNNILIKWVFLGYNYYVTLFPFAYQTY